jgi:hypothetical protein
MSKPWYVVPVIFDIFNQRIRHTAKFSVLVTTR